MNRKQLSVFFLVLIFFLCGCSHRKPKAKSALDKPHDAPADFNFKSTPKDDAKFFQTLGVGIFNTGDWPLAEFYFKKAVKLDSKLYLSWYCLGVLNIENEEGYNYLKKSTAIKPDFPGSYYWMAYHWIRKGEDKKAISLLNQYLKLAKDEIKERERMVTANEILQDLLLGREGKNLKMIRKSGSFSYENIK
jgi:tetratricopeptide (TPR) repeat protein